MKNVNTNNKLNKENNRIHHNRGFLRMGAKERSKTKDSIQRQNIAKDQTINQTKNKGSVNTGELTRHEGVFGPSKYDDVGTSSRI